MRSIFLSVVFLAFFHSVISAKSPKRKYDLESWMRTLSPKIRDKKLSQIAIPGTHNSGSYPIKIGSPMTNLHYLLSDLADSNGEVSPSLMNFVRAVGPGWTQCQDHSIAEQLKMGHRYLDLRVYCDEGEYFLHHFFVGSNFTDELVKIAQFAERQEREVIILHVKSISNCVGGSVRRLLQLIGGIFGDKLAPPPSGTDFIPTYGDLVKNGTTVVVAMPDGQGNEIFDWLWDEDRIVDPWANTASVEKVRSFVIDKMGESRSPGTLFVSQIILTATTENYMAGFAGSGPSDLREMTLDLNKDFRSWVGDVKQLEPNIFITDFATKSLIRKIIDMNFKRDPTRNKKKGSFCLFVWEPVSPVNVYFKICI
ncbi:hypothetical protein ACHWQZ_G001995 [Mnemiopsis leidyi]